MNCQKLGWKSSFFGVLLPCTIICGFFSLFKDSELNELRKTIELLKKQNAAAQAAINGVINTPELNCKGERQAPHTKTPGLSSETSVLWVRADVTIGVTQRTE